jgi:hypothetical protein
MSIHRMSRIRWTDVPSDERTPNLSRALIHWTAEQYSGDPPTIPGLGWYRHEALTRCGTLHGRCHVRVVRLASVALCVRACGLSEAVSKEEPA